jgi:hypothetical protein
MSIGKWFHFIGKVLERGARYVGTILGGVFFGRRHVGKLVQVVWWSIPSG